MTDDNDTSKLVILVLGLGVIGIFAYLIYKDHNKPTLPTLSLSQQKSTELERIEQRLLQLETKIDSLSSSTKITQSQPERTIVSMNKPKQSTNTISKMLNTDTKKLFDMR